MFAPLTVSRGVTFAGDGLRQSCTQRDGQFLKNLSIIESDLGRVCIIDNSPIVYSIVPGARPPAAGPHAGGGRG